MAAICDGLIPQFGQGRLNLLDAPSLFSARAMSRSLEGFRRRDGGMDESI